MPLLRFILRWSLRAFTATIFLLWLGITFLDLQGRATRVDPASFPTKNDDYCEYPSAFLDFSNTAWTLQARHNAYNAGLVGTVFIEYYPNLRLTAARLYRNWRPAGDMMQMFLECHSGEPAPTRVVRFECNADTCLTACTFPHPVTGKPFRDTAYLSVRYTHAMLALPALWLLLPATALYRHFRRRHAITIHRCPVCDYDLRATPTRCPECGHQPHAGDAP